MIFATGCEQSRELFDIVPVQVAESEENFFVRAAMPGIDVLGLEVDLCPTVLILKGKTEHRTEKREVIHSDFCTREIFRRIDLPSPVDPEKTTAKFRKGHP